MPTQKPKVRARDGAGEEAGAGDDERREVGADAEDPDLRDQRDLQQHRDHAERGRGGAPTWVVSCISAAPWSAPGAPDRAEVDGRGHGHRAGVVAGRRQRLDDADRHVRRKQRTRCASPPDPTVTIRSPTCRRGDVGDVDHLQERRVAGIGLDDPELVVAVVDDRSPRAAVVDEVHGRCARCDGRDDADEPVERRSPDCRRRRHWRSRRRSSAAARTGSRRGRRCSR